MEYSEEIGRPMTVAARAKGEKMAMAIFPEPPIDVEKLIDAEGMLVIRLELPMNVSGRGDLDQHEIYVNSRMHWNHQRFTLAHELGHFVLHHKNRRWEEFVLESSDTPLEQEANAFASGLLMPAPLLKKFAPQLSPAEMAHLFHVSEEAMWIALLAHKLI